FNTYALDAVGPGAPGRFVDAAVAEIGLAAAVLTDAPPLRTVFFGGGTPTALRADQLITILDAARSQFRVDDDLEVTVESNPDGLHDGQLAQLRDAGVNRVSFGLQSIRTRVLRVLDRTHDPEQALRAVDEAHRVGFDHVSLDLIYGTPGERDEDWAATLDAAIGTGVDHISAYALAIEPSTKLAARVRRGTLPRPDDDLAARRYQVAEERLTRAGFDWYELSNWSRSIEGRCRHNLLYWRNQHWWGIGPGAHSHLAGVRWWNRDAPDEWATPLLGDGGSCAHVGGHEVLDDEQREMERVLTGIRLAEGLPLTAEAATRLELDDRVRGLAEVRDGRAVLTTSGRLLADEVVRSLV
ncbi:MAG: radical SAM family heme chaperone HemW, partial [Actinomycetota bacterium]|nr:radical SAM family heme chaperone HemW [Actinomycetota bacterium]